MDNAIWNGSQPIIVEVDCDDVHTMLFGMGLNLLWLKRTMVLYSHFIHYFIKCNFEEYLLFAKIHILKILCLLSSLS